MRPPKPRSRGAATSLRSKRPPTFPVVLAGFAAFLDLYATQPLLPLFTRMFRASHFAVSLTVTAATVAVAVAAPLVGRLADRIGRKRVIVSSALLLGGSTALAATATTLPQLVLWRFVQGLATPGVFAITVAYIHDEWPASHVGRATAAYISGTVTGGFSGRALVGLLAGIASWQRAFVVLAALNAAAAVALAVYLPRDRRRLREPPSTAPGADGSLVRLVSNGQLIATDLVGFCVLFTQVAMFTYVTFHLGAPPYALGTVALGWLFVVYLVGAVITPFAGRLIDRHGHRSTLAVAVAIGVTGAFATLVPSLAAVVAGLALVATGVFIAQATASSYVGVVTEFDRGLAIGVYSSFYYIGGSVGAALPALFWNAGGWWACVGLVIFVQAATAAIAFRFWRDPRRQFDFSPAA